MKKQLDEKKIIEILKGLPVIQELFKKEEEREKIKEERIKAAQEIERLKDEQGQTIPKLEADLDKYEQEFAVAKEELTDKKKQLNNAIRDHRNIKWGIKDQIKKHENFLRRTAPDDLIKKKEELMNSLKALTHTTLDDWPEDESIQNSLNQKEEEKKRIQKEIEEVDYEMLHPKEVK